MPNTFPSNAVSSAQSTLSSQAHSFYPTIRPLSLGDGKFKAMNSINTAPGYNSDGDFFELPTNSTGVINYNNSAGSLVWSQVPSGIVASADQWVGFTFDKADDVLYVVVRDIATTPNTYSLASIDSAGSTILIGSGQPSNDFGGGASWGVVPTASGASTIFREQDGFGDIVVHARNAADGIAEMVIDITDGSIISDPSLANSSCISVGVKTSSGAYISLGGSSDPQIVGVCELGGSSAVTGPDFLMPYNSGIGNNGDCRILRWKDYFYAANPTGTQAGPRAWTSSSLNTFAQQLFSLS